jgi:hypothetical protein
MGLDEIIERRVWNMENPLATDWEEEKKRLLKKDYRHIFTSLGVALALFPLAHFITTHFDDKDIVLYGVLVYAASLGAGILAVFLYKGARDFGKEWYHPGGIKNYWSLAASIP